MHNPTQQSFFLEKSSDEEDNVWADLLVPVPGIQTPAINSQELDQSNQQCRQLGDSETSSSPPNSESSIKGGATRIGWSGLNAESYLDERDSCRTLLTKPYLRAGIAGLFLLVSVSIVIAPVTSLSILTIACASIMLSNKFLRLLVLCQSFGRDKGSESSEPEFPVPANDYEPIVSILVPLHDEQQILPHLIRHLSALDYPASKLDIRLLVESADNKTRDALADFSLPGHIKMVTVQSGPLRTKPRALNYALGGCRGSIVGVYDAEDAPEPDQIWRMVRQFSKVPKDVVCLQGKLDFYNTPTNWLSRCFTVEYASWYRVVLPAFVRLGLPIPLGGTTLFFRRNVLEEIGAWDAHNVTEDADLGMRLARYGYRAEILDSTTFEEANCRVWPWVKQRSRWIKGYAITYLVQMRRPAELLRQLGMGRFIGFQVLFLGSVLSALLAPLALSYWIMALSIYHPVSSSLPDQVLTGLVVLFIGAEVVTLSIGFLAVQRSGHKRLVFWVPTLHLYYPLASLAAYRGIYELVVKPFHWDKTAHGVHGEIQVDRGLQRREIKTASVS